MHPVLAQAMDLTPLLTPLIQAGIPGIMLAWFMFRNEKKLSAIEQAIDRMTRSALLLALSASTSDVANVEVRKLIAECDDAAARRRTG